MKKFLITILLIIVSNMCFSLMVTLPIQGVCKILGYEIQLQECIELAFYLGGIVMSIYCFFLILNTFRKFNL